jgi:hypothetical protein
MSESLCKINFSKNFIIDRGGQRFAAKRSWRFLPQMYLRSTEPPITCRCCYRFGVLFCLSLRSFFAVLSFVGALG